MSLPDDWPDHSAYGWRARLGLIVPPTNTTNEAEWQRMVSAGVTVHSARMPLHAHAGGVVRDDDPLVHDLIRAASDLAQAGVAAIAYGCAAGSMTEPLDRLPAIITRATGIPGTTTAGSAIAALRESGVTRLALAAPYGEPLLSHEAAFFARNGFEVVGIAGLGIGTGGPHEYVRLRTISPGLVMALARRAVARTDADGLFLACTDMASIDAIDALEADLGIPVISSNQAQLWTTLRAAGVFARISGWGRLLAK